MNRTQYAAKNAFWGTAGKIISLLFAFLTRTAFIYILGNTYLGVNGLYSEILSLLSIAELGFGSAVTFAMYKPVASDDTEMIVKLLSFFKTIYRIVAGVIAALGLCLLPFLGYIVKGADWLTAAELKVYFLIYLFNTVIGYFVSYRYTYLNARHKCIPNRADSCDFSFQKFPCVSSGEFRGAAGLPLFYHPLFGQEVSDFKAKAGGSPVKRRKSPHFPRSQGTGRSHVCWCDRPFHGQYSDLHHDGAGNYGSRLYQQLQYADARCSGIRDDSV